MRIIQERAEFPNGIKEEWQPSRIEAAGRDADVRKQVAQLNREAKAQGSYLRYRSVEQE